MAPVLAFTVAPDGQIGLVRQGCQQIEQTGGVGLSHLRAIAPGECTPGRGIIDLSRSFDQTFAGANSGSQTS
jgi:hypothetical protein